MHNFAGQRVRSKTLQNVLAKLKLDFGFLLPLRFWIAWNSRGWALGTSVTAYPARLSESHGKRPNT